MIISKLLLNGRVECGCGTFVVVNRDGWIVTAAHVLNDLSAAIQHGAERNEYDRKLAKIRADPDLSSSQRRRHTERLTRNPDWISNHSYWWSQNPGFIRQFETDVQADLAVGRIEPFTHEDGTEYPVFANPAETLHPGTSLCRLGYPFHQISATYDPASNMFNLAPGVLPMPRFPNEGIHTRTMVSVDPASNREVLFVETSSPGLKGQSGGPIFDQSGRIWAIQSRTMHLPLGFSPKIKEGNREIVEYQFMHIGLGAHVREVTALLDRVGASYRTA